MRQISVLIPDDLYDRLSNIMPIFETHKMSELCRIILNLRSRQINAILTELGLDETRIRLLNEAKK